MDVAFAVFSGRLLGSMVDPLTWGVALGIVFGLKRLAGLARLGLAVGTSLLIAVIFLLALRRGDPSNGQAATFSVLATTAWTGIFLGVERVFGAIKVRRS